MPFAQELANILADVTKCQKNERESKKLHMETLHDMKHVWDGIDYCPLCKRVIKHDQIGE